MRESHLGNKVRTDLDCWEECSDTMTTFLVGLVALLVGLMVLKGFLNANPAVHARQVR